MTVFAWIETLHGKAIPASWEALAAGKMLADKFGVPLTALVLGDGVQAVASEAAQYGATKAIVCEDATLKDYRLGPDFQSPALVMPATVIGIFSSIGFFAWREPSTTLVPQRSR